MIVSVTPAGVVRKVLIVDDDAATRSGLAALLKKARYHVIVAGSFAEARFALSESAPDLLISDIRLGEFNGLQLVATTTRAIPAIIVTGYPDTVLEAEARRLGAEFLIKPIVPSALLALVKRKLEAAAAGTPVFSETRRWIRKQVSGLAARIENEPVQVIDVSYGGIRLDRESSERTLPPSFRLDLPVPGVSIVVDLVWTTRTNDHWLCGLAVNESDEEGTATWHELVDSV
jgi:DNA-binding response OmpR family regulator